MLSPRLVFLIVCIVFCAWFTGCGVGIQSAGPPNAPAVVVAGVAAGGSALIGTVTIKDATGRTIGEQLTDASGAYSFSIKGFPSPYILKADGLVNQVPTKLYSVATSGGTANINPITNLALSTAAKTNNPENVFTNASNFRNALTTNTVDLAVDNILHVLQPLLILRGASNQNPLRDAFAANHEGLDGVLDVISLTLDASTGAVNVKNKVSQQNLIVTNRQNFESGSVPPRQLTPQEAADLNTVASDLDGIISFLSQVSKVLQRNGHQLTTSDISSYIANSFGKMNGMVREQFLSDLLFKSGVSSSDGIIHGLYFEGVTLNNQIASDHYCMTLNLQRNEGSQIAFPTCFKKESGIWKFAGNNKVAALDRVAAVNSRLLSLNQQLDTVNFRLRIEDKSGVGISSILVGGISGAPNLVPRFVGSDQLISASELHRVNSAILDQASGSFVTLSFDIRGAGGTIESRTKLVPKPMVANALASSYFPLIGGLSSHSMDSLQYGSDIEISYGRPSGIKTKRMYAVFSASNSTQHIETMRELALNGSRVTFSLPSLSFSPTEAYFDVVAVDEQGREFETKWFFGAPNQPPVVSNIEVTGSSGDISIRYDVADSEGDSINIGVQYSTDGGSSFQSAVTQGSATNLLSGSNKIITWLSSNQISSNESNVIVRLTPFDSFGSGAPVNSSSFSVSNQQAPPAPASVARPYNVWQTSPSTQTSVDIAWSPVAGAQNYKIYRCTTEPVSKTCTLDQSPTGALATVSSLTPFTNYFLGVAAVVNGQEQDFLGDLQVIAGVNSTNLRDTFFNLYKKDGALQFRGVKELSNGDLLYFGFISGNVPKDGLVIRTDRSGNEIWEKRLNGDTGGDSPDRFYDAVEMADGTLRLVGYSQRNSGQSEGWFVALDSNGNRLQSVPDRFLSASSGPILRILIQDASTLIILREDGSISRLSNSGAEQSTANPSSEIFQSGAADLIQLADGGFAIVGNRLLPNIFHVVRTNSSFTKLWEASYGDTDTNNNQRTRGFSLVELGDKIIVTGGSDDSANARSNGGQDLLNVAFNADSGAFQWETHIGGTGSEFGVDSVKVGSKLVVLTFVEGASQPDRYKDDVKVMILNGNGLLEQETTLGTAEIEMYLSFFGGQPATATDLFSGLMVTSNGDFVFAGSSLDKSTGVDVLSGWGVRLNPEYNFSRHYDANNSNNRLPIIPGEFVAITTGSDELLAGWSPSGNDSLGYKVYLSTQSNVSESNFDKMITTSTTSVHLSGLQNSSNYYVRVASVNSTGSSSLSDIRLVKVGATSNSFSMEVTGVSFNRGFESKIGEFVLAGTKDGADLYQYHMNTTGTKTQDFSFIALNNINEIGTNAYISNDQIIHGGNNNAASGDVILWLVETDLAGTKKRDLSADAINNQFDSINKVIRASSGGFFLASDHYWILRTKPDFTVLWNNRYRIDGNNFGNKAMSIAELPGHNYVIAGWEEITAGAETDARVVKIDSMGRQLAVTSYKSLGGDFMEGATDVMFDHAGNIVVTGFEQIEEVSNFVVTRRAQIWVRKLDDNLQTSAYRIYASDTKDVPNSIQSDAAGNYIVSGVAGPGTSSAGGALVLKIDSNTLELLSPRNKSGDSGKLWKHCSQTGDANILCVGSDTSGKGYYEKGVF